MKKKAGSALGFSPEKPEDLAVLLSLLAARGIGELDARREVGAVMAEIAAGVMAPPGHWPAYVESRIRRAKARAAREAKAAKAYTPPPPVSQFGRTYT